MPDMVFDGHGDLVPVDPDVRASALSFIEDHEMVDAHKLVDAQFIEMTGRPLDLRVAGYMIAVKIYVPPQKTDGGILLTDNTVENARYASCAGLVVGMGPQAYKGLHADGTPRFPEGPWCRVGDWILLPKYEATLMTYRKVAMGLIPDDRVQCLITDPKDVDVFAGAAKI